MIQASLKTALASTEDSLKALIVSAETPRQTSSTIEDA
jgi:hypothetical protein